LAIAGTALLAGISSATAATLPTGFEERTVVSGLTEPTAVDWAPGVGMLVAEKRGRVRVVTAAGTLASKPLVDISGHVNTAGDRGLLGIAVDSSFASNRFLYLLYTYDAKTSASDQPKSSRLTRVTVNPDNTTASGETVLLGSHPTQPCPLPANNVDCIPSDGGSHSIGTVRSAPDGTLWIGSGDGANYGGVDPRAVRTHDEQSFSGKLTHIDRNGLGLPGHPFCPEVDNLTQVCTKVWAKGFRNPFRFTIRPNGRPAVGDVGWGSWEELNLAQPGRNYGWPCYEGTKPVGGYSNEPTCKALSSSAVTMPDHFYAHGSGSSIIGGPTYPVGGPYPDEFDGDIFFGDYVQGFIKRLELDGSGKPTGTKDFATDWFGVDIEQRNGELYYVNFGQGSGTGSVVHVAYSPNNATPIAVASATPMFGASPLKVAFKGSGSTDPDGDTLKYEWDFGDGTPKSATRDPSHIYMKGGNFDARLKVTDTKNASSTATVRISVNNAPPVVTLAAPLDGSKYRDGVPVQLSGSATDPDDGALADAKLSWNVALVHGTHLHPFSTLTGKKATFTPTTDHDADSFYRVTLTATDSDGATASKTIVLRPEAVNLSIASTPAAGAPITYAGYSLVAAPHKAQAAIGFHTSVAAAQRFAAGGRAYEFAGWSDGGAVAHDVVIPATDLNLVARYRDVGPALTGSGGFGPGSDRLAPRVLFGRAKGRRLTGTVTDAGAIASLKIAIRSKTRSGCRWWNAKAGRLARRPAKCARPRWMKAVLKQVAAGAWTWQVPLARRLPAGRYKLVVRAVDTAGNVSAKLASGKSALRVTK